MSFHATSHPCILLTLVPPCSAANPPPTTCRKQPTRCWLGRDNFPTSVRRTPPRLSFECELLVHWAGPRNCTWNLHRDWVSSSQWRRETLVGDLRCVEIIGPTRHWPIDDGKDLPEQAAPISTVLEMFPAKNAIFEFESATSPDSATQCFLTKAEGEKHLRHAFSFD
jgi:hypothetical protein